MPSPYAMPKPAGSFTRVHSPFSRNPTCATAAKRFSKLIFLTFARMVLTTSPPEILQNPSASPSPTLPTRMHALPHSGTSIFSGRALPSRKHMPASSPEMTSDWMILPSPLQAENPAQYPPARAGSMQGTPENTSTSARPPFPPCSGHMRCFRSNSLTIC